MRRSLYGLLFGLALVPGALAQSHRVGLGISANTSATTASDGDGDVIATSPITLYVPIHTARVRFEPEIGLVRLTLADVFGEGDDATITAVQAGVGVAGQRVYGPTAIYGGVRVGVLLTTLDIGNNDSSDEHFYGGPMVGGEHFLGDRFSLGAEAQLLYRDLDDTAVLNTQGLFFARFYF